MLSVAYPPALFLPLWLFVSLRFGFVSTSGLQAAMDMQEKSTARREQIDTLQGKIQHLKESMEKLYQVKSFMCPCMCRSGILGFDLMKLTPVLLKWISQIFSTFFLQLYFLIVLLRHVCPITSLVPFLLSLLHPFQEKHRQSLEHQRRLQELTFVREEKKQLGDELEALRSKDRELRDRIGHLETILRKVVLHYSSKTQLVLKD